MVAPEVSVIMAAYNGERYIAESMRSVLAQTHSALELVVIDDGSIDGTWEIVNAVQRADERVVYAFQPNGRQGRARNHGIRLARAPLVAFCDQDDLWVPEKLERQLAARAAEPTAGVVFSDGFLFYDSDVTDERTTFKTLAGSWDGADMFRLLFAENRIPVLSTLVCKADIERVGMLDEDPAVQNCDDWELWLRLAAAGVRFVGMSDRLVRYRLHSEQASRDLIVMGKAELSVLEQFRHSTLLAPSVAASELARRYEQLVDGLDRAGRGEEAAAWSLRWLRSEPSWAPLWRTALYRVQQARRAELARARQRIEWLLEDPIRHGADYLRRRFGRA
ncbi:MAG TPA: glycosyltransferase [Polyangia bacterium]